MATPTVKLVADITPTLKAAFDKMATKHGMTKRAAIEQAIADWVVRADGRGKAK